MKRAAVHLGINSSPCPPVVIAATLAVLAPDRPCCWGHAPDAVSRRVDFGPGSCQLPAAGLASPRLASGRAVVSLHDVTIAVIDLDCFSRSTNQHYSAPINFSLVPAPHSPSAS